MQSHGGKRVARALAAGLIVPLLSVAAGAGPVVTGPARPDLGFDDTCGCGKANTLRLRHEAGLATGEPLVGPSGGGYAPREAPTATDVLSNDLDIEVNHAAETIAGSNTIRVRSKVNGLTQFTFMLRTQYTITSILLNGVTPASATTPAAGSYARTVTLDRAYNLNEEFTVRIAYNGVAMSRGFGSIEFVATPAGDPLIATLSEAYFAGTWWPVKDGDFGLPGDNGDKATIKLAVTAPSTLRTVSNGLLLGIDPVAGGKSKYRWQSNYPTSTYLAAFCTTIYNTWTQTYNYPLAGGGTGAMPVEFNIYPGSDTPGNRAAWGRTLDMLPVFRTVFGEYPFINEKYGIYQFPFGGGMEHQTNTGQGTFNESVTAHELAHQWWGDMITCKTWNHIWLNEGFATYSEALWSERATGSINTAALHAAMAARRPATINDSVYVPATTDMNRIFSSTYTYRKGAWALHQLRHVIGDEDFFATLAQYRALFEGGAATTDDFAAVASAVSGVDLTRFFQQWVYGIGAPAYAYGWQNVTISGQNYLKLHVRQTQDATWPGGGAPAGVFAMPVDLKVDYVGGNHSVVINNDARSEHFVIPIPGPATAVTLDEFNWILNTAKASEAYINGPAKLVAASPLPDESLAPAAGATQVALTFSEAVSAPAAAFSLTGPSGAVPFSYSYNPANFTATLTTGAALGAGVYTVSIAATVTALASGAALDGEITAGLLPSGNGLAGGVAAFTFEVAGVSCGSADFDGDGDTGTDLDIEAFFACLGGSCCPSCGSADFDGDGDFGTDLDIEALFRVLGGGSC